MAILALSDEFFRLQCSHASHAGRSHRLPVYLVDHIACSEDPGYLGRCAVRRCQNIALIIHRNVSLENRRRGIVADGYKDAINIEISRLVSLDVTNPRAIYAGLARDAGLADPSFGDNDASEAVIGHVTNLLRLAGFPLTLQEHGFSEEEIPELAAEAVEQWTAEFNPREVSVTDFEKLYASVFSGVTCR